MSKRYIDANKLRKNVEDLHDCYNGFSDTYDKACIIGLIDEQPTADVVERKKGKWMDNPINVCSIAKHCSRCGYPCLGYDSSNGHKFSFCPNCGADMREETKDDNN